MLSRLKMSQKLIGGFVIVVVLLSAGIVMQILAMQKLAVLQDDGARRAANVVELGHIMETLDMSYGVIADGIINRNLDANAKELAELQSQAAKDQEAIMKLVDTPEETALAKEFSQNFQAYLAIYTSEILPLLKAKAGEAVLDPESMKAISTMDGRIDEKREAADAPLAKIVLSLTKEMEESDKLFDQTRSASITLATIIAIASSLIALAIAFLLTRSITRPINETVQNLTNGSDQISAAAGQVATASQSLAEGASEQASALEETSASMEELTSMTKQNADNASQADNLMRQSLATIASTNQAMAEMDHSMNQIATSSEQTSKIIKTIDEIAFQTNLLALNAAVEAARAGEAGAGFAVVADEVRNLAMRATEAAKNTASLIEDTVLKVKTGKEIVSKVTTAFKEVTESSTKVGALVGEISVASKEQAQGIGQINQAITQMDSVTQQNAASSEESAAAAEELNAQAESMIDTIMVLHSLVEGQQQGGGGQRRQTSAAPATKRPAWKRPPAATAKPAAKKLALPAPAKKAAAAPTSRPKPAPKPTPKPKANDPEAIIPMGDDDNFEDF